MPNYTAKDRLDEAAVFLNDHNRTQFSFDVLLPFLKIVLSELEDIFVANSVNFVLKRDVLTTVAIGTTVLTPPADMLMPIELLERPQGATVDQNVAMVEKTWEPGDLPADSLKYWTWQDGETLSLLGALTARDVTVRYYRALTVVNVPDDAIAITHVKQYISGRVASLAAFVIGENVTRAQALDDLAQSSLNRALAISAKRGQSRPVRRKPYGSNRRMQR